MEIKKHLKHVSHGVDGNWKCLIWPRLQDAINELPEDKDNKELSVEAQKAIVNLVLDNGEAEVQHLEKYKELYEQIKRLTYGKFIEDIELAMNIKQGYYKSVKTGKCAFVQGFDVDGSCSLLRGGMNAEDYGVYAHWSVVHENGIDIFNRPIHMFTMQIGPGFVEDYYVESTKEEYEAAIKAMEKNALTPFVDKYPIEKYVELIEGDMSNRADFRDKFRKLFKKFKVTKKQVYDNGHLFFIHALAHGDAK